MGCFKTKAKLNVVFFHKMAETLVITRSDDISTKQEGSSVKSICSAREQSLFCAVDFGLKA